jgi:hypothetical protein
VAKGNHVKTTPLAAFAVPQRSATKARFVEWSKRQSLWNIFVFSSDCEYDGYCHNGEANHGYSYDEPMVANMMLSMMLTKVLIMMLMVMIMDSVSQPCSNAASLWRTW